MNKQYLVQKNSFDSIKYLLYTLTGEKLTKKWGQINGSTQEKSHIYKGINIGKKNELSPKEAAESDFDRIIEKKIKEGYLLTESLDERDLPKFPDLLNTFDLDNIPTEFCCSKPTQKISEKKINSLIVSEKGKFFVKYNGGCHYILINKNNEVKIFTRRWNDHTRKYPKIVKATEQRGFPAETLFIVELCVDPLLNMGHMWAFKRISEIFKTDTFKGELKEDQSKSDVLQDKTKIRACIFGVLYYKGKKVWNLPYSKNLKIIKSKINSIGKNQELFFPQELKVASVEKVIALVKKYKFKIEGLVLWDMNASMEVTMNGKPLRRACWKIKAKGEMDVIAYGGKEGKVAGKYGSIKIGRKDKNGKLVNMGTVAGLKVKEGECDPEYWEFPCVIEVTYDNIFPDTGCLQFGSYSKIHEDKTIEEVLLFT